MTNTKARELSAEVVNILKFEQHGPMTETMGMRAEELFVHYLLGRAEIAAEKSNPDILEFIHQASKEFELLPISCLKTDFNQPFTTD